MRKKVWIAALFLILALAVAVSLLVTVSFGSTELSLQEVYAILYDHLFADDARVHAGVFPLTHLKIVWQIRLPRTIFALLVGAGLSVCGGALKGQTREPAIYDSLPCLLYLIIRNCFRTFTVAIILIY